MTGEITDRFFIFCLFFVIFLELIGCLDDEISPPDWTHPTVTQTFTPTATFRITSTPTPTITPTRTWSPTATATATAMGITFHHVYGIPGSRGWSVQQTRDRGYILTGETPRGGTGKADVILIKTNDFGQELWSFTYGGEGIDVGYIVRQTSDGGYIVAGRTDSFGHGQDDIYLVKTDTNGICQWTRVIGSEESEQATSLELSTDGGFIIGACTTSLFLSPFIAVKTASQGYPEWIMNNPDHIRGDIKPVESGGYIMSSYFCHEHDYDHDGVRLTRLDHVGREVWGSIVSQDGLDKTFVASLGDSGFMVYGSHTDWDHDGLYETRVVDLIRTDSLGNVLWSHPFTASEYYQIRILFGSATTDGGHIVGGEASPSLGESITGMMLMKTNISGSILWTRLYRWSDIPTHGQGIWQTDDDGYAVIGDIANAGYHDSLIYLVKTDSFGMVDSNSTNTNK